MSSSPTQVLALSGGIGGAKLALGLSKLILDESLMVVAIGIEPLLLHVAAHHGGGTGSD